MITPAQAVVLKAYQRYLEKHGFPPSVRELINLTGLRSTSTVQGHLDRLRRSGAITNGHRRNTDWAKHLFTQLRERDRELAEARERIAELERDAA